MEKRPRGEGESWYRMLVERVPAVVYVDASDELSSAVYMSPQSETLLGYSREEWLSDPELWVKTLHPGDRERVLAEHDRARGSGEPFKAEYRLISRDGRVVWVRDEAAPIEEAPTRRAGVLLDITERVKAEEALRWSEERFGLVAKATGEAIRDSDLTTGRQTWDGATEALFGYPPHQSRIGEWWEERVHHDDRERVLSGLEALYRSGGEVWEEGYRFRKADGTYPEVEDRGYVVRDGFGKPVRMVGSMRDVTEKRRREEELRRSEELFRLTFERAGVGMAHIAPDGRWLRINDELCRISDYSREDLLEKTFFDLTPPEDVETSSDRMRRMLEGRLGSYTQERRYVRKDSSRVWVNLSVSLVRKASGEPDFLVCTAEDITGRKLEELVPDPLTPGEMDVLRLAALGLKNREIAKELGYSMYAIKLYMQCIFTKLKLEVRTRQEAVARAVDIGLIKPHR